VFSFAKRASHKEGFCRPFPKDKLDTSANDRGVGDEMKKKATIVISLVDESCESSNEEIRKEIFDGLTKGTVRIPWCKKIEKVEVA
jgi:hypothetical protein